MIALIISAHLLKSSTHSTEERIKSLCIYVANLASRIPPTLCYAKAQNNNHMLSEAVGLYTAAAFLPDHPKAARWRKKGLRWFERAVETQIADDGIYIQYSTNYHRLMLMLSLWMQLLLEKEHLLFKDEIMNKLASAAGWLAVRLDKTSGQVPNLGHNDGSNILPFSDATATGITAPLFRLLHALFWPHRHSNPGSGMTSAFGWNYQFPRNRKWKTPERIYVIDISYLAVKTIGQPYKLKTLTRALPMPTSCMWISGAKA